MSSFFPLFGYRKAWTWLNHLGWLKIEAKAQNLGQLFNLTLVNHKVSYKDLNDTRYLRQHISKSKGGYSANGKVGSPATRVRPQAAMNTCGIKEAPLSDRGFTSSRLLYSAFGQ